MNNKNMEETQNNSNNFNKEVDVIIQTLDKVFSISDNVNKANSKKTNAPQIFRDENGDEVILGQSEIKTMRKNCVQRIHDLKKLHRKEKKQPKNPIDPKSGKRHYAIMYAGPCVYEFFNEDYKRFGYIEPFNKNSGYLMDRLPMLRQGFFYKITISIILPIYFKANNIEIKNTDSEQSMVPNDPYFKKFFCGKMPAVFFFHKNHSSDKDNKKREKLFMEQAIEEGLVNKPLNTLDVIKKCNEPNKRCYPLSFNNDIGTANNYSFEDLDNLDEENNYERKVISNLKKSKNPEIQEKIHEEYQILKEVSTSYKNLKKKNKE